MSDRAAGMPATELPEGWAWAELGELGEWYGGSTPSKSNAANWNGDVPWISPKDMKQDRIRETADHLTQRALSNGGPALVPSGAVVMVVRSGILRHTVPLAVTDLPATLNQDMKAVVPYPGIDPDYLCWALRAQQGRILETCTKHGTTVHNIVTESLHRLAVPLAPLYEQRRIVERIDTLLSEITNGIDNLDAVDRKLATYRQSFLKAAVTGELTRDVRDRSRFSETGPDLLQRVLKERATEARSKNKKPFEPNSKIEFEIPDSWTIATVDQLSLATDYGTSAKCSPTEGDVPVLRMGNLQHGELDLSALKYLPSDRSEFPKLLLRDGDLLFNRTNSADLVGKTSVYRGNPPRCSFASYIVRVQLNGMIPEFLAAFINSIFGRRWIKSVVSQQVGQANVNSTKLRALSVPLPPLDEQQIIVDRLEDLKSGLDRARAGAEGQSSRAASLRRSILNSAFSGRLVPQNPSDEPASELLARIRLERAKAPKTSARRGRPRKTSGTSEGATP